MRHMTVLIPTRLARVCAVAVAAGAVSLTPGMASASDGLNLIPDTFVMLGLMTAFIILIYPVNALLFKPIFAVLDARSERIEGARRRAEQLQREADEVTARYREAVRDVRQEAEHGRRAQLDEARSEQTSITSAARAQAEQELARTRGELRSAVDDARSSLRSQVEDLARQAAERIVGRELS